MWRVVGEQVAVDFERVVANAEVGTQVIAAVLDEVGDGAGERAVVAAVRMLARRDSAEDRGGTRGARFDVVRDVFVVTSPCACLRQAMCPP
jgi:hypothetical protein